MLDLKCSLDHPYTLHSFCGIAVICSLLAIMVGLRHWCVTDKKCGIPQDDSEDFAHVLPTEGPHPVPLIGDMHFIIVNK